MSESRISFGRACCAEICAVMALVVVSGCSKEAARASGDAGPSAVATAGAGGAGTGTGTGEEDAGSAKTGSEDDYARAKPLSGKSIGHTSVVFKLKLEGRLDAAYKPRSKVGKGRYRGEIAAYRLATALGLPNVPPAYARSFDLAALQSAVGHEAIFAEVVPEADGSVHGALIPWIKDLDFIALEKDPWRTRWHNWLAKGLPIATDYMGMASQVSTMIVFDYVTGNWDRWSGGNVGKLPSENRILYIDNDGAFFDPPPAPALERQLGILEKVDRFSRRFVTKLREIDVRAAIGDEMPGTPLLSAQVLAQVEERRKKALAIIDAKTQANTPAETFFFE